MKIFTRALAALFLLIAVNAFAQVTVSATVSSPNPINLDQITYTVTLTNPDPLFPAVGVFASCPIPRGIKFLEATPDQGDYDASSGLWTVGAISPSSTIKLKLKCIVNYFNSAYDVRDYFNYNILLTGDASFTGSSIGGKVAAGGNITAVGSSIGGLLPTLNPAPSVLNAQGILNFTSGSIFHGDVTYGGSTNLPSPNVVYPQGSLVHGNPFDFTAFSLNASTISTGLAGQIPNGTTTFASNKLTLTGSDIYLNVFDVPAANFSSADSINVYIPKGAIGIINVLGASAQFVGSTNINGNLNNFVLFNFPTTSSLSLIGSHFQGSILAPNADINCIGTLVQGQIFSKNLQSISSHDLTNFVGYVPLDRNINFLVNVTGGNSAIAPLTVNTTPPFGSGGDGSWSVSSVFPDNVWALSMARLDSNSVLVGTFGGRIYHVDNGGVADTVISATMLPASAIWSLAVNDSGHIFAATTNGLMRSNDKGLTWSTALPLLDIRAILIGLDSNLYAGSWGFGVYKSTDHGYTWTAQNQNIGSTVVNCLMDKLDTNALSTPYTIFAGAFQAGLSASGNSAASWLPLAMPYPFVTALAKTTTGILLVGTQQDGVYRSYDNGNSFQKLAGLPAGPINTIRVDGSNNIFVTSWMNDIYASSDMGTTWNNLGLGGYGVSTLFPMPGGGVIVGTKTGKLYYRTSSTTQVKDQQLHPAHFALEQNYPNPFNPSTTINFSLPANGRVSLKIYNSLGQEVRTLVNEERQAGNYSISFSANNLPSGIYFYTLRTGNFTMTKKMLFLK
jgi:choice-of-anchor A domain-containing protein/uncharacterized repeat protein (TIGR01451 family)